MTARFRLGVALSVAVAACGGNDSTGPGGGGPGPAPVAGVLGINVDTPLTDTGAMLFSVNGAFQSIAAVRGYQLLSYAPGSGDTRVMVVGSIVPGTVLQLTVADKSKPVFVSLQQVAGRAYERRSPGDYRVTVTR